MRQGTQVNNCKEIIMIEVLTGLTMFVLVAFAIGYWIDTRNDNKMKIVHKSEDANSSVDMEV